MPGRNLSFWRIFSQEGLESRVSFENITETYYLKDPPHAAASTLKPKLDVVHGGRKIKSK